MKNLKNTLSSFEIPLINLRRTFNEFLENNKPLTVSLILLFISYLVLPFIIHQNVTVSLQIIIIGAVLSSLYAVLALGFSLIYGVAKQFKLSLGGYFVIGAYSLYFLLETVRIIPGMSLVATIEGMSLLVLLALPVILSLIILVFFWNTLTKEEFALLFLSDSIATGSTIVLRQGSVAAIYTGFAILLIGLALWYMELPPPLVARFTLFFAIMIPIFILLSLPAVYIALMIIATFFTAFIAMMIDRWLLDKVRDSHINTMIVTFSVALLSQSLIQILYFPEGGEKLSQFGPEDRTLSPIIPTASVNIFGALVDNIELLSLIVSLVICAILYGFIWFSRMGMALRAAAQDEEAAALTGIDIRKTTAIVSGIGMGLVAFAATLTSPFSARPFWNPFMGWPVLILAISVVTLGGMGSLPGSLVAAFIIGYAEVIIASIPGYSSLSVSLPFVTIILVIIFKPEGLFGSVKELE